MTEGGLSESTGTTRDHPVRGDIEGLRALAVISVLVNHAFPNALPGGFVGVDIFFVISGYLIGRHLLQDIQENRFSILGFYAKRVRRIFPALALVLLAVWGIGWLVLSASEFSNLGQHIVASAFFSNNILLWSESGYFDVPALDKPLLHLWSLGIEEQFYLLVPGMLWLGSKGSSGSVRWVARLGALSLVATVVLSNFGYSASFYLLHTRFWELAAGVVLAQGELRMQAAHSSSDIRYAFAANARKVAKASSLVGIILICTSAVALSSTHWPGARTLFPVIGTAMVIAATPSKGVNWVLSRRPFAFVGGISYPLYLWHWPSIVFWKLLNPMARGIEMAIPLAAAVALAWLTKVLLEDPVRFGRLRSASFPRPQIPAVVVGLLFAAALGSLAVATEGLPSRLPPQLQAIATWSDAHPGSGWRTGRCYYSPNAPVSPNTRFSPNTPVEFSNECTPRKRPGVPLVLLWGDSHAAHLYPGLAKLQSTHEIDIIQWTAGLCPPTVVPFANEAAACRARRATALKMLAHLNPDTVLLAGAWEIYVGKTQSEADIIRALSETIRLLRKDGDREIVVVGPGPTWNTSLASDLFRFMVARRMDKIPERYGHPFETAWHLDAAMADEAHELGVHYVSVLNYFCNESGCRTVGDKTIPKPDLLYFDSNHLTVSGSEDLIMHSDLHLF
jgi:peptidoglycan/LPS O-acetylase OafA/YrhL